MICLSPQTLHQHRHKYLQLYQRSNTLLAKHPPAEAIRQMNKEETLALFAKGKDAWNAWADEMLLKKEEMEGNGNWRRLAEANFHGHIFDDHADFSGFHFPGNAQFIDAIFLSAHFDGAEFLQRAHFISAEFKGLASFDESIFHDFASFVQAQFSRTAYFSGAQFRNGSEFHSSIFDGNAVFIGTSFSIWGDFVEAQFQKVAVFTRSHINGEVDFREAKFMGKTMFDKTSFAGIAKFGLVQFENVSDFANANFLRAPEFVAIQSKSQFSLQNTVFAKVPDFSQAHFSEAPRLDNAMFPLASREKDEAAKWRALKRLALQGHDHEREQTFFANELLSLRGASDWPVPHLANFFRNCVQRFHERVTTEVDGDGNERDVVQHVPIWRWRADQLARKFPVWPGGTRYWIGLLYQWFSNFGRSMLRPVLWWVAIMGIFTFTYLGAAALEAAPLQPKLQTLETAWANGVTCTYGTADALGSALYLALNKGLVVTGIGAPDSLNHAYVCLYGVDADLAQLGGQKLVPKIPLFVALMGILQTVFSATLIFLFLLAVRNHFRIR